MTKSPDVHHGHYIIKTLKSPSGFKVRAFRGQIAVGSVFEEETLDKAIHAVKEFLNDRASDLRMKRGLNGFPSVQEVREGFAQVSMNKAQEAMLNAHMASPDHVMTATELARAAGYRNYSVANSEYGKLARKLAEELDWTPSEKTKGMTTWTFTLAESADRKAHDDGAEIDGHWRWQLRSEIVEALSG